MINPKIVQQPVTQLEPPKEETKPETLPEAKPIEKPKVEEPKYETRTAKALPPTPPQPSAPIPRMDFDKTSATATLTKATYSVQLMASLHPVDYSYFKIDSISVTISPDGYYRYSVGYTDNLQEIEELLQKVRNHGYNNVWVRINREHPGYTIQFLALQKPKSIKHFEGLSDVMVYRE